MTRIDDVRPGFRFRHRMTDTEHLLVEVAETPHPATGAVPGAALTVPVTALENHRFGFETGQRIDLTYTPGTEVAEHTAQTYRVPVVLHAVTYLEVLADTPAHARDLAAHQVTANTGHYTGTADWLITAGTPGPTRG